MKTRFFDGGPATPATPPRPVASAAAEVRAVERPSPGSADREPSHADGRRDAAGRTGGGERRRDWTIPRFPAPTAPQVRHSAPFLTQMIAQGADKAPAAGDAGPGAGAPTAAASLTRGDEAGIGNRRYETGRRRPGMSRDSDLGVYAATGTMAEAFVVPRYGDRTDRDGIFVLQAQPVDVTT